MNKKQREEVILMERKDPVSKYQVLLTLIRSIIKAEKHYKFKFVSVMFVVFVLFVSYSSISRYFIGIGNLNSGR